MDLWSVLALDIKYYNLASEQATVYDTEIFINISHDEPSYRLAIHSLTCGQYAAPDSLLAVREPVDDLVQPASHQAGLGSIGIAPCS